MHNCALGLFFFTLSTLSSQALATLSHHWVGGIATLVPGGGQLALGNYGMATLQAGIEVSSFTFGFVRSPRAPLTLDGAPESIPKYTKRRRRAGREADATLNITGSLWADWAQEIGIKYHMVNVFDAYRKAAAQNEMIEGIDQAPINDLFLAPFEKASWTDPFVILGTMATAAAVFYDYHGAVSESAPKTRIFDRPSRYLYAATYIGMYPVGSAAPEEMFFRGYLQNELYALVPSPYFSVPLTALAFGFLHVPEDYWSATAAGLLFGTVTHVSQGILRRAIAIHYWLDVFTGIESYLLFLRAQEREKLAKRPIAAGDRMADGSQMPKQTPVIPFFQFSRSF